MFPLVKRGGVTWVKGGAVEKEVRDNLRDREVTQFAVWGGSREEFCTEIFQVKASREEL